MRQMLILLAIYLIFLIIFAILSSVGLSYLHGSNQNTRFCRQIIVWYKAIAWFVIAASIVLVIIEYFYL